MTHIHVDAWASCTPRNQQHEASTSLAAIVYTNRNNMNTESTLTLHRPDKKEHTHTPKDRLLKAKAPCTEDDVVGKKKERKTEMTASVQENKSKHTRN